MSYLNYSNDLSPMLTGPVGILGCNAPFGECCDRKTLSRIWSIRRNSSKSMGHHPKSSV